MKIKDANEIFGHHIVGGSEHCWRCWPNARFMDYENELAHASVVFDTARGTLYEATVTSKDESVTPYRWLNPQTVAVYKAEARERDVDLRMAWDDVQWVDCEVWDDWAEKAGAIWRGETPDSRVQVALDLTDEELMTLFRAAHDRDITLNQLVAELLQAEIDARAAMEDSAPAVDSDDHTIEWEDYSNDDTLDESEEAQEDEKFRELCLKPHEPQADDTSTSDIEHSHYWYDTDRNRA